MSSYTIELPDGSAAPQDRTIDRVRKLEGSSADAVSPKGAIGLYQITPATASAYGLDTARLKDPTYSERAAHKIISDLEAKFPGDEQAVLVAYNAGPGRAKKWVDSGRDWATLPAETRKYLTGASRLGVSGKYTIEPPDAGDAAPAKPAPAKPKPTPRQSALATATEPLRKLPGDIGHEFMEAGRANQRVITAAEKRNADRDARIRKGDIRISDFLPDTHALTDAAQLGGNALAQIAAPVTGAIHSLVGRPTENTTGSPTAGRVAETAAGLAIPVAGEVRAASEAGRIAKAEGVTAKTAREIAERAKAAPAPKANALKATVEKLSSDDPEHIAAVNRLKAAGVKPAAHQAAGGSARRLVESAKSNPYVGEGVRKAEEAAGDSFNRALYNKVLEPLGEKVPDTFPVGRDGVRAMKAKMDHEYDAVLPHVRVVADKPLIDQLAEIRTSADKLGEKEAKQFETILNQDVLHKVGPEGMDGRTFKDVESDLLRQARGFKGSQDPNQRSLGKHLEGVVDALRENMVDHSPAQYRARLKGVNAAYARFTRLEDAAAARKRGGGYITPSDLLGAVKKGDHSVRKGAFARGDALLQDFAEDADRVLSPKVGDSGTTERALANRALAGHGLAAGAGMTAGGMVGGPVGAGVGGVVGAAGDMAASRVTNALAARALSRASRTAEARNYLKAAQARSAATTPAALAAGATALPRPPGQTNQP